MKRSSKKNKEVQGLFIPGGLFIGMGIGIIVDQLVGGLFIGLGVGFVLMAVSLLIEGKKK